MSQSPRGENRLLSFSLTAFLTELLTTKKVENRMTIKALVLLCQDAGSPPIAQKPNNNIELKNK